MNISNATLAERNRKNIKFNQESAASHDFDVQRSGGTKTKSAPKDSAKKTDTEKSGHEKSGSDKK